MPPPHPLPPKRCEGGQFGGSYCQGLSLSDSYSLTHRPRGVPKQQHSLQSDCPTSSHTRSGSWEPRGSVTHRAGRAAGLSSPLVISPVQASVFLQSRQLNNPSLARGKQGGRGGAELEGGPFLRRGKLGRTAGTAAATAPRTHPRPAPAVPSPALWYWPSHGPRPSPPASTGGGDPAQPRDAGPTIKLPALFPGWAATWRVNWLPPPVLGRPAARYRRPSQLRAWSKSGRLAHAHFMNDATEVLGVSVFQGTAACPGSWEPLRKP